MPPDQESPKEKPELKAEKGDVGIAQQPKASFLGAVTREGVQKAVGGFIGVVLGGALLFYLHDFKQTQDTMKLVLAAEHGHHWANSSHSETPSMKKISDELAELAQRHLNLESAINRIENKTAAIVRWTELLKERMAKVGTDDKHGRANLNDTQDSVIFVNTRHPGGRWFEKGDHVIITNRHAGAQGPEYSGHVTSAYPFQKPGGETEVLLQISKGVATNLQLPLEPNEGIFSVSIRKERSTYVIPSVTELERKP